MVPFLFVIGFLSCVDSFAQEQLILEHSQWGDVVEELKLLRKEVEENRKLIIKQESELRAVKLELEETKRNCNCEPNSIVEKSESEKKEFASKSENVSYSKDRNSKIKRSISSINPPTSHNEPIAFYAYMSAPIHNVTGHHTLIFDVIKSNSGLGLQPSAGVFTAPKTGFYVFTWTIRVYNNSYHCVELVVNGQAAGAFLLQSGAGDNDIGSTTAVVHVNEGENVFLRTTKFYNQGVIYSDIQGRTSFAGWKLT